MTASATLTVYTPYGPQRIREDTAAELGIRRGERIGTSLWHIAIKADYDRDREDRRQAS